jgi:hypothetical protein
MIPHEKTGRESLMNQEDRDSVPQGNTITSDSVLEAIDSAHSVVGWRDSTPQARISVLAAFAALTACDARESTGSPTGGKGSRRGGLGWGGARCQARRTRVQF